MVAKVNGAAYPGIWVEKQVTFVKISFFATNGTTPLDISALPAADLYELGTTTPVSSGTVADGTFAVVESVLVQALETLETNATILGISAYNTTTFSVDVMLGYAESWFSDLNGIIATALPVPNGQAIITTAGSAAADAVGTLVTVAPTAVTYGLEFVYMNGSMPVATSGNGALETGPGATSGATPTNSPTGTPGFYPKDPYTA